MPEKPKLSMYWAASCGGCEIALVNLHEKILDVDAAFDFVFCPCLLDTKKRDVEAMPDGSIALTLFNGAIRTEENEEMAHLLRRKSRLLIAFGSCSYEGCIPGLGNLSERDEFMRTVYLENPTTENPGGIVPRTETEVPEGVLHLPSFYDRVRTLAQVTGVDYFIPGCPPEPHQIGNVVEAVVQGKPLPPKGSVIGAGRSSVCEECSRKREDKKLKGFRRIYEFIPDREKCLLDQGVLCMGIATRDGCGALCPKVNMPCTGCYGPPEGVLDQGAKMVAALGSLLDIGEVKGLPEEEIDRRIDALIDSIPDFAGTFYKYSLPGSILKGRIA
ncbi:MAG: NADH:ubiquinone oxidoreductase [Alphaproteobacteria bacterium]|uniref:NADH:ubiquinone oxidoreductase n=1 Tax=Candidatus Nitrobium versatile TaxID=2884831 RepID=A0A953J9T7_9BACT|nr:NADH:ubiquinone oxidoreductase [Candidatus Nitrobium versatile]